MSTAVEKYLMVFEERGLPAWDALPPLSTLSPLERGELLHLLWSGNDAEVTPGQQSFANFLLNMGRQADGASILLDGRSAERVLDLLANQFHALPPDWKQNNVLTPLGGRVARLQSRTIRVLSALLEPLSEAARLSLQRLLPIFAHGHYALHFIVAARLADRDDIAREMMDEWNGARRGQIAIEEAELLWTLPAHDFSRAAVVLGFQLLGRPLEDSDEEQAFNLDAWPPYLRFIDHAILLAAERVNAIHRGQVPFAADKGFTVAEGQTLRRVVTMGLRLRSPLVEEGLETIWRGAALAPDEKVKAMPSQSVAIGLGHAVVAAPTAKSVASLAGLARDVRHAGVKKKLVRMLKAAKSALAQQPDFIFQLDPAEPVPKSLRGAVTASVENLFAATDFIQPEIWLERFSRQKELADIACSTIWELPDGQTAMPTIRRGLVSWMGFDGAAVSCDGLPLRLWHPVSADQTTRDHWRRFLEERQITQPFAQAFREHYHFPESDLSSRTSKVFAGHETQMNVLGSVASGSGWKADGYASLSIRLGGMVFEFEPGGRTYPGSYDIGPSGTISIRTPGLVFSDVPERVASELLRRIDLLVSVGSASRSENNRLAGYPGYSPGERTIAIRRERLERLFPKAQFEGRHLVGPENMRIHLATARVTRNGDPVDITPNPAIVWLPYRDDVMLKIIQLATQIFGAEAQDL